MAELAVLFKKNAAHDKRINTLETTAEVHRERLDRHSEEFRTMNQESAARDTRINHTLTKYSEDMQEFVKIYHEQQGQLMGATRVGKWGIGVILTLAGLVIAYIGVTA
jgi:aminoglycoside/choline kinase family phosphotransferase